MSSARSSGHSPAHAAGSRTVRPLGPDPAVSARIAASSDRDRSRAFYSWVIKPAERRTSSRSAIWVAGPTVAMAGLAAGLAVGLPGAAAAQSSAPSHLMSRNTVTSSSTAGLPAPIQAEALGAAKSAAERTQEQITLAEQRAARQRAEEVAAERRVWGARAAARAAAARAAAARAAQQAAAKQASQSQAPAAQPAASGSPQQIAEGMLASFGWSTDQFSCLDSLWAAESGWNVSASNPSSGAYGIPQALPGSKMASAGPDWQTDAATQIRWGLGYIQATYGSPCAAWSHEEADGWY